MLRINTISQLHEMMGFSKPKHPLISIIDAEELEIVEEQLGIKVSSEFYMISLKDKNCGAEYGKNSFDFDEGVLVFTAPNQIKTFHEPIAKGDIKGWMLYFHPDLIRGTYLGSEIDNYSFFDYEVFEALHLSDEEEKVIEDCKEKIRSEYEQRIDNHSQRVIVSNLELLLNYCLRFYERQFNTRKIQNSGIAANFDKQLKQYFKQEAHLELGIPSTDYFAEKANLSPHYFSDLLSKETGRTPKDHINAFIIEKAKDRLAGSKKSVSEIAYELGFNYPHYFNRVFKQKTGKTPLEYRNMN